jgi:DNA repair photolyase
MPQVISASRRTDIPAFYSEWFVNRLKAGYVFVKNPYSQKPFRVSLKPGDVNGIVFWSKNYSPILSKLESIEKTTKHLFFHFTITANKDLEPNAPDFQEAIKDYLFIARRYSPEQIVWRFDPICITDKISFGVHEERFVRCAELLKGITRKCIISFVHPYKKVLVSMKKYTDQTLMELSLEQKKEYALRLAQRAETCEIKLYACCNDYLLSDRILKASCIDGLRLSSIFNIPFDTKNALTRKECACTKSVDIGAYDTCAHGCVYCYANADKDRARDAQQRQNSEWNALGLDVKEEVVHASQTQPASS